MTQREKAAEECRLMFDDLQKGKITSRDFYLTMYEHMKKKSITMVRIGEITGRSVETVRMSLRQAKK